MAEWAISDVKAVAPEFTTLDDPTIQRYIDWAYQLVNPIALSNRLVFGGALMTAHLLTVLPPLGFTGGSGAAGAYPVSQKTIGQVSISYAVPQVSSAGASQGLALSRYGIQFSRLVTLGCFSQVL